MVGELLFLMSMYDLYVINGSRGCRPRGRTIIGSSHKSKQLLDACTVIRRVLGSARPRCTCHSNVSTRRFAR